MPLNPHVVPARNIKARNDLGDGCDAVYAMGCESPAEYAFPRHPLSRLAHLPMLHCVTQSDDGLFHLPRWFCCPNPWATVQTRTGVLFFEGSSRPRIESSTNSQQVWMGQCRRGLLRLNF
ncbi:hypothetical protein BV22DRAFT_845113 [Leucogyrophana mollusca]|uniref:Uncharacterized protein n=1 Tax=Leucogyrophana mollusca TaxID=85980 RepID=A0ACB8B274_9AGAM|nr:hypothetical protein BV22DRAFT_845113 [Leucogyrophana mollusca]